MPVGRVYQPPPRKLILPAAFEKDGNSPGSPVRRNFVIPSKVNKTSNGGLAPTTTKTPKSETATPKLDNERLASVEVAKTDNQTVGNSDPTTNGLDNAIKVEERLETENGDLNGNDNGGADDGDDEEGSEWDEETDEDVKAGADDEAVETKGEEIPSLPPSPPSTSSKMSTTSDGETDREPQLSASETEEESGVPVETNQEEICPQVEEPEPKEELKRSTDNECALVRPIAEKAKGLKNLGNTCFMNSIIQCLAHTRKIIDLCQRLDDYDINLESKTKGKIIKAFASLVNDMWAVNANTDRSGDASTFKREMGNLQHQFHGYDQHDSQEFLSYALDGIHNELNRGEPLPPPRRNRSKEEPSGVDSNNNQTSPPPKDPDDPYEPGISPVELGNRCWRRYLKRDDSPITDLFLGQLRSTLRCEDCSNESVTFEPFWFLSIPIPSLKTRTADSDNKNITLQDCLDLFVKEEVLDGDEKPTCEKCQKRTKCSKWYAVERWPSILVLHLKRFNGSGFRSKLSSHIDIPVDSTDLRKYGGPTKLDNFSSTRFSLYGISNHSGSLHGGHYTAYCKHPGGGGNSFLSHRPWFLYNDRAVSNASKSGVISYEAYCLFFERATI